MKERPIVLGVIPARGASKGFPGKNVALLRKKPLIHYTIDACLNSRRLTDSIVSTDSRRIANVARRAGGQVPFLRPAALATDRVSIWPTVLHAVRFWEKMKGKSVDVVALFLPTSPLRTAEDIDRAIDLFFRYRPYFCLSVCESRHSPYFDMVEPVRKSGPWARSMSAKMTRICRRQDAPPVYTVNGAIYLLPRRRLNTMTNPFRMKRILPFVMPEERSIDVDTHFELRMCETVLKKANGLK